MSKKNTISIRIAKPGVLKVGDYKAGQIYQVDETEAERLVRNKGFEVVKEKTDDEQSNA